MPDYVPRFYQYRPPPGSPLSSAIESALGAMGAVSKLRGERLTQEEIRQKIEKEKEMAPLEIYGKKQALKREEEEEPLDIEKKHKDIQKTLQDIEKLKEDIAYSKTLEEQAHATTRLRGAQEQNQFAETIKNRALAHKESLISALIGGEGITGAPPGVPRTPFGAPPGAPPGAPRGVPSPQIETPPQKMSSLQQGLTRLADINAALKGRPLPSAEADRERIKQEIDTTYAQKKAWDAATTKDMVAFSGRMTDQAQTAMESNMLLDNLLKETEESGMKGAWTKYVNFAGRFDPHYVASQKDEAMLQFNTLQKLRGLGQVRDRQIQMIINQTPNINMPSSAMKWVASFQKAMNTAIIEKNNILQKYKNMFPDRSKLWMAINNIAMQNNYVDSKGKLHLDAIHDWRKIATPARIDAEYNSINYSDQDLNLIRAKSVADAVPLPKGLTEEDITYNMNKYGRGRRQIINDYLKKYGGK